MSIELFVLVQAVLFSIVLLAVTIPLDTLEDLLQRGWRRADLALPPSL